jgi:23S rRNA pseudouridine1911/1915/1917 synthase
MVINKPAGLSVHPSRGTVGGTLANAVTYYWQNRGLAMKFRPINRLDKDTSGLILVGKSQFAHQAIARQQRDGSVSRRYLAVVEGIVELEDGSIEAPIALQHPDQRQRIVSPRGRSAVTRYTVLQRFPGFTLLALTLETGRTHQLRVHLSFIGHPICGDTLYGRPCSLIERQALHAATLNFLHPRTGESLSFEALLPTDMIEMLKKIARQEIGSPDKPE